MSDYWAIPASWQPVRHGLADRLCQCQGLVRCQSTQYALDASGTLSDNARATIDVREEIVAAYAMATIKTGALTLVPGVRVEHTVDKAKIVNAASTLNDGYNSYGPRLYRLLPRPDRADRCGARPGVPRGGDHLDRAAQLARWRLT
jgi:hypothetical protein